MPNHPRALAAVLALPGTAALLAHSTTYALAALLLCTVLPALPTLINVIVRWHADRPRRERDRIGNQALSQIAQTNPERTIELLARLPPPANPFEREPSPAEGPGPPSPVAPPDDPEAGGE